MEVARSRRTVAERRHCHVRLLALLESQRGADRDRDGGPKHHGHEGNDTPFDVTGEAAVEATTGWARLVVVQAAENVDERSAPQPWHDEGAAIMRGGDIPFP